MYTRRFLFARMIAVYNKSVSLCDCLYSDVDFVVSFFCIALSLLCCFPVYLFMASLIV